MAKHLKLKPKNSYFKKIGVPIVLGGLMIATSGSAIAAEPMTQTQALKIVTKAGEQLKTPTLPAVITADSKVKISFSSPTVSSTPAPVKVVEPSAAPVVAQETPQAANTPVVAANPAQATPAAAQAAPVAVQVTAAPATEGAATNGSKASSIASAALSQIGVMQDCTALVSNSLSAVGISFHGWPKDYLQLGQLTNTPVAGDLIYYADGGMGMAHIAVYISPGTAVHGGWNGNETRVGPTNLGSGPVYIHVS